MKDIWKWKFWNHWRIGTMKGIWKFGVKKVIKISRNKKWTSGYWTVCQSDTKWEHLGVAQGGEGPLNNAHGP